MFFQKRKLKSITVAEEISHVHIAELTFLDGISINLDEDSIIVVVGPNNTGKSLFLRELLKLARNPNKKTKILKKLKLKKTGTEKQVFKEIESYSKIEERSLKYYVGPGYEIYENRIEEGWKIENGLGDTADYFCHYISTEERLKAANTTSAFKVNTEAPKNPIQFLFLDQKKEENLSEEFKRVFGEDLILNRLAGSELPVHVGKKENLPAINDITSYSNVLNNFPRIDQQGDGMRSFAGILIETILVRRKIVLIDEPEAFLHPPQAKSLAKILSEKTSLDRQLFISTHSKDILNGLLDSNSDRIQVIRLDRKNNSTSISKLNSQEIKNLWEDPILRYSDALNGIFHQHVIICEADADCKFYQTILEKIFEKTELNADVLFVNCNGKHKIPRVVRALKALKVPTSVIVDIDIISNQKDLKDLIDSFEISWDDVKDEHKTIHSHITNSSPPLKMSQVKAEIEVLVENTDASFLDKNFLSSIEKILSKSSPWEHLKKTGEKSIPRGKAFSDFNKIKSLLKSEGIFLVPVGEMEGFDPTTGGKGAKWVVETLSKNDDLSHLTEAMNFMKEILDFILGTEEI